MAFKRLDETGSGQLATAIFTKMKSQVDELDAKIGNAAAQPIIPAYTTSATALSAGWLSETNGGTALTPVTDQVYLVKSPGDYQNVIVVWNGTAYAPIGDLPAVTELTTAQIESAVDAAFDEVFV